LQVFRFFSTVNLLFAVPVGICAWRIAQWYVDLKPKSVVSLAANRSTTSHAIDSPRFPRSHWSWRASVGHVNQETRPSFCFLHTRKFQSHFRSA
jgi:hypothetical protein